MSLDTAMRAFRFVSQNADAVGVVPHLDFFGGEPLLQWDEIIVPLVRHIREVYTKPCELGITTNCIALDEEKLSFLRKNSVGMLVSMDGDKETHDTNRKFIDGSESFQVIFEKVPLILKHYPNMSVRMTLTPDTAQSFFHDVQFLLRAGFKRVECVPNSFVVWSENTLEELRQQLRLISNDYIKYFSTNYLSGGFREFTRGFRDVKRVNAAYVNGSHRCDGCARCGIGIDNQAAINYLGDIYPCHEANCDDELRIGNIFTGIDNSRRVALSKQYSQSKVYGLNCGTCRFDHVCNGGCAVFDYMIYHDFNHMPQMACAWKQMILDECEYILSQMERKKNIIFRNYFLGL